MPNYGMRNDIVITFVYGTKIYISSNLHPLMQQRITSFSFAEARCCTMSAPAGTRQFRRKLFQNYYFGVKRQRLKVGGL